MVAAEVIGTISVVNKVRLEEEEAGNKMRVQAPLIKALQGAQEPRTFLLAVVAVVLVLWGLRVAFGM